jgi:phosphate/sulfate permease
MHVRSPLALRAALAGVALCLSAGTAQAQQALAPLAPRVDVAVPSPARTVAPAADSARVGPTVDAARVAASEPRSQELSVSSAAQRRAGLGQPVALMVVGGAALLAGLIIGGDAGTVIAVGGALVGLYGLYEYLQ